MTYQEALEQVKTAMGIGDETFYLAQSFAQTNDTGQAIQILAEQYHEASRGVDDFDMTVLEYVKARLDEMEYLLPADAFEDESESEQAGFFWLDEFEVFVKLNF